MICKNCDDHEDGICEMHNFFVDPDQECRAPKPPAGAYKLRCSLCGRVRYGKADDIRQLPGLVFEYDCSACGETNRITLQHLLDR